MTLDCTNIDLNFEKTLTIVLGNGANSFFDGFSKIELRLDGKSIIFEAKEFVRMMIEIAEKNIYN